MKQIVGLMLLLLAGLLCFGQHSFNITAYGASTSSINNSAAIQSAVDAAHKAGGGNVIVPAGRFITGSVELKSGVQLQLETGAFLVGSDKRKDYDAYHKPALIVAVKQHQIGITGNGTIDGNGRALIKDIIAELDQKKRTDAGWNKTHRPGESARTNLFYFEDCDSISIKSVQLKDATSWVTHYERCRNIFIDSIRLESVAYWNNDGIDLVDCKNVQITNSFINAADDAICLKSVKRDDYCDSIFVDNCTLRSSANAFKLGTASYGGFKNITVKNITVYDTYRSAIALEAVDGGFLENIHISNVTATNTGSAVLVRLGHRNKDAVYSTVKHIYIGNIKVTIPKGKPDAGYEMEGPLLMYPPGFAKIPGRVNSVSPWNYKAENPGVTLYKHNVFPSSITGIKDHPVENVTLENFEIIYNTVASKSINYFPLDSFNTVTEAEKDYPEFSMFGEVPAWGLYVRHVQGLTMKNIRLIMKGSDYRPAMLLNDVKKLELDKITTKGKFGKPALFFKDVLYAH